MGAFLSAVSKLKRRRIGNQLIFLDDLLLYIELVLKLRT